MRSRQGRGGRTHSALPSTLESGIREVLEPLLSKTDIAERYNVSTRTVERWIASQGIASASPGKKPMYRKSDVLRMEPDRSLSDEERDKIVTNLIGE